MTPARFKACLRLLRGITIQADMNKAKLRGIVIRRDQLESEMKCLARLVGDNRFADRRLLSSISRRIGVTSGDLNRTQHELDLAFRNEMKFDRAKTVLKQRIHKHEAETEEQLLMDLTIANVSFKLIGQCATRKRR